MTSLQGLHFKYLPGCTGFSCSTLDPQFLLQLVGSLVATCELLVAARGIPRGIQFPDQESKPGLCIVNTVSQPLDCQGGPKP